MYPSVLKQKPRALIESESSLIFMWDVRPRAPIPLNVNTYFDDVRAARAEGDTRSGKADSDAPRRLAAAAKVFKSSSTEEAVEMVGCSTVVLHEGTLPHRVEKPAPRRPRRSMPQHSRIWALPPPPCL